MLILGVETSCDETSVSIIDSNKKIYANIIYSQIEIHKAYGGVVPEVASRHHLKKITHVFEEAFKKAGVKESDIDLVCVTKSPGLVGSLFVGINAAKMFSIIFNIKYVEVDHIIAHIYANLFEKEFTFPLIALVVSGGHTELILMKGHYDFVLLGKTLDDAVGEAYDKVGRVMGLSYPAGAVVDKYAFQGENTYNLPLVYLDKNSYNFSFSGLKSSVLNVINKAKMKNEEIKITDLCCSFQNSVITVLTEKTVKAALDYQAKQVLIAGGVAANKGLRERLSGALSQENIEFIMPSLSLCTDNAAMVAMAGFIKNQLEKK